MEKVNILLSRFQPFTLGHLKCCTKVYKQRGIKTVLCVIDNVKPKESCPFRTKAIWTGLKNIVKNHEEIIDIVLIKSVDILKIGQAIGAKGYEIVSWCCGTDRFNDYSKMCKKYTPSVEVIEIKRDESSISATQVRDAILKDKEDIFKELTPQELHKSYKRFKSSLEALD